jgi:hypothetical protein
MTRVKSVSTPIATCPALSKLGGECMFNPFLYRSIVGLLQHATITLSDIAFAMNKVSQFMHNPLAAVK